MIDELENRTAKVLPSGSWQVHYALFTRSPLTRAAEQRLSELGARHVAVAQVETDDRRWAASFDAPTS